MLEGFAEELLEKPSEVGELVKANVQLRLLNDRMSTQESLLTNIRAFLGGQETLLTDIRDLLGAILAAVEKGEEVG